MKYFKILMAGRSKKRSCSLCILATIILGCFFSCNIYALERSSNIQVFANGKVMENIIFKDGRTYAQLNELSNDIGYNIEFNAMSNTVNFYKQGTDKPIIKRIATLFPSDVKAIENGDTPEIVKTYILSPWDNPTDISRESFEENGYNYTLTDITKNDTESTDKQDHTETVTINTSSKDINTIMGELKPTIDYTSSDGHTGNLKLDISSIQSRVKGYKTSSYKINKTREYPNLSNEDVGIVPKIISYNGKILKLANVTWKATNTTAVDFNQIPDTYTATATYSGTGSSSNITGYTTTANYIGTISKNIQGKTIYTAYFTGTKIAVTTPEPTKAPTAKELAKQLKDQQAKEKSQAIADRTLKPFNPMAILIPLLLLLLAGGVIYFVRYKGNIIVYARFDDKYRRIGTAKLSKNNSVDLTNFQNKIQSPDFTLVLKRNFAKSINGQRLQIIYNSAIFTNDIDFASIANDKKLDYEIPVEYTIS